MGLLDNFNASGIVNDVTGQPQGDASTPFPTFIKKSDDEEDSFGGTCQPDVWTPILDFRIPAGVKYAWGYGAASAPDNQGYIYVFLKDNATTPAEVTGTLRLKQTSATGREMIAVKDLESDALHGSKTDRKLMVPLPEQSDFPTVRQDSHMVVEFMPDSTSAVTISKANTDFRIPATEYDLSTE